MYTSACIKEAIIVRKLPKADNKENSHSHSWNDEDHAFDYKLDQWGVEKFFQNSDQAITREMKFVY